ncbi:MAG: histidine kinase dimerization/phosphoacceptor domain -containing protein [Pseudomonadota bacterium]
MIQQLMPKGLQVRLILLMTLVLLPLGGIAIWQSAQMARDTRQIALDFIYEATESSATDQQALIQRAVGAATGLASIVAEADLRVCRDVMRGFVRDNDVFATAGYMLADGQMTCTSWKDTAFDMSGDAGFQAALARDGVFVGLTEEGAVTGQPVLYVTVPVIEDGAQKGLMTVSLRTELLLSAQSSRAGAQGLTVLGITSDDELIDLSYAPSGNFDAMPAGFIPAELRSRGNGTFIARDTGGTTRMYSVHEAAGNAFVMLGSIPLAAVQGQVSIWQALAPAVFAVLMWCASMAVAFVGLNRLVLRHLAGLRSAMRRFALGERGTDALKLDDAPEEFEDAERAFNRMALIITDAEAQQLTDLHDKEVLLREVHHRVKNNLQMIASIMNLQSRKARTSEAREMLDSLKGRVRALATLHRSLNTEGDTSQVDARDLITAVVSETSVIAPDPDMKIDADLSPVRLYPQQAVPLSMWATEALTNAVKHAGSSPDRTPSVKVALSCSDAGDVTLHVENTVDGVVEDPDNTGLGTTLMTAFCRQLGGTAEVDTAPGHYAITLRFAVEDFEADEPERRAPKDAAA